jgi:hypothetical protein
MSAHEQRYTVPFAAGPDLREPVTPYPDLLMESTQGCETMGAMKAIKERLTWYRLRDPAQHESVYGDQITDVEAAFERAAKLAGFYQRPIEVCQVVVGKLERPVGQPVAPGPTAPIG